MADKRKLQGEIERCMKKVTEGVETFEDIWQKVHNATSANQKEKYEADLKKEIKKLQRLRDQIKTWLTSNDIKDKRELMEKRKLIETQMERFKVIERETKMKAYSKEGLGLATKIDPAQKEKEEVRQWLMDCLNDLQMQIDQFESEIESIRVGSKKKKLDRDRQDRVDELAEWVDRHRFHIKKLEGIMRMMDNCSMETEEVKSIQDDLNYYVESNQEPDFAENELIYEDLSLEDAANVPGATHFAPEDEVTSPVAAHSPISSGPLSPKTPTSIKSTSQELFEERRRGKTSVSSDGGGSEIVPQSPRRPGPKSLLQNSSNPSRQPSGPILKTPTPTVASAKSLKTASLPLQPSHTATQKQPGNNGASTPSTVQPPHAYAVAAGGNQTPHPTTTPLTSQPPSLLGSQPESEAVPSLPHPPVTLPHQVRGSLESSGSYSQQHSRSSSSSSSLSPSLTPSSTQDKQAPSLSLASAITSVTSSSAVVIATSTGAGTSVAHDSNSTPSSIQSAMSPSLSSFSVSVNSSPGESPATQTAPSLSPIHVAQLGPASLPISSTSGGQLTSSHSGSSLSGIALTRTDSSGSGNGGIGVTPSSISAPSLFSPGLNQPPGGLGGLGIGDPQQPSVASSGSSSAGLQGMTSSISSSFNFPVRSSSSSFSPTSTIASAISAAISGSPHTNPGAPFDNFRFPVTAPSPTVSDSIVAAQGLSSLKSIAAEVVASHDLLEENKSEDQEQVIRHTLDPSVAAPGSRLESMLSGGFGGTGGRSNRVDPQLQPLLGVAPLGPIPLSSDRVVQLRMLESSYKHLPQLSDSERVRPYLQRNPYPTAHHHHQHPPPLMDSFEFYQRLSIESLFFMFYYMEGTKAQYMAAKALKKLSWRFHTKYMTWFQRLEEPKAITDEYEMGTYIYFDYEKWAQRKKDGFTFEYRFLEDRELP